MNRSAVDLYLDLLARALVGDLRRDAPVLREVEWPTSLLDEPDVHALMSAGTELLERVAIPAEAFTEGRWSSTELAPPGESMVGLARLENVRFCLETALAEGIPGDVIETGVWRGGCAIFMKGVLAAHGDQVRRVVLADSFLGVPPPTDPHDEGLRLDDCSYLAVSREEVLANFRRYELLDHGVEIVPGWFRDSLPTLRDRTWCLLRLDGDLYESTTDALVNLYDGLSVGGFVLVDDYGAYEPCRQACDDFRTARGITDPVVMVDWTGAYWRKSG